MMIEILHRPYRDAITRHGEVRMRISYSLMNARLLLTAASRFPRHFRSHRYHLSRKGNKIGHRPS